MAARILLSLVLVAVCASTVWAGFEEGLTAYERGDYAITLNE